jgi:hypothetical protein
MQRRLIVKKAKQILSSLLIVAMVLGFYSPTAHASNNIFFEDVTGDLSIIITSTAATSGIKLKTIGWQVRNVPSCDAGKNHCDPRSSNTITFIDAEAEQTSQMPDPPIAGQPLTTYFQFSKNTVESKFFPALNDTFAPGQMLYFSAIMVSINGDDGSVRKCPLEQFEFECSDSKFIRCCNVVLISQSYVLFNGL